MKVIGSGPVKPLFPGKLNVKPEIATLVDIVWGQGGQFLEPEAHRQLMVIVGTHETRDSRRNERLLSP